MPSLSILALSAALAEEPSLESGEAEPSTLPISVGAEVGFASAFLYRTIAFTDTPVLQPSIWGAVGPVTFGFWWSATLDPGGPSGFREWDLWVGSAHAFGAFTVAPTAYAYSWPFGDARWFTAEILLDLDWIPGLAGLRVSQALDVVDNAGGYWASAEVGLFPTSGDAIEAEILLGVSAATARHNARYLGTARGGPGAARLSGALTWRHGSGLFLTPSGEIGLPFSSWYREAVGRDALWCVGLLVGFELVIR